MVYFNASRVSLGSILMQNEKSISYASRQLKCYDKNHPTYDLELVDVVFSFKIWDHYFYDIGIIYHQGIANVVVDALCLLSMTSPTHVEEENRDVAKDVHIHTQESNYGFHIMRNSGGE